MAATYEDLVCEVRKLLTLRREVNKIDSATKEQFDEGQRNLNRLAEMVGMKKE